MRNLIPSTIQLWWLGPMWLVLLLAQSAKPCPFCSALSSTLTENLEESEVAGLAICVAPANLKIVDALPLHCFRIEHIVKGDTSLVGKTFEVYSFRPFELNDVSFLVGVGEGNQIDWAPSPAVSDLGARVSASFGLSSRKWAGATCVLSRAFGIS